MSKTETKDGRVARDFTLEDVPYKKGKPITLPANQFDDLESVGLVEPKPAAKATGEEATKDPAATKGV